VGGFLKVVFLACLALLPLSCWLADDLDADLEVLPSLSVEPRQTATRATPFTVAQGGVEYRIEPLHDYALEGMVVSVRHHDGDRMLHKLWNDHLNVADLCVVWGSNTDVSRLREFEFWSGQFTCFFRTRNDEAWGLFRPDQLSNNHLITADGNLRQVIDDVRIGDQVRLRGQLARYGTASGFARGTSVTRDDTGNGACETIYVTDFQIMRSMDTLWRSLEPLSWFGLLVSGVGGLVGIARGTI
jgi:hypothetical protein